MHIQTHVMAGWIIANLIPRTTACQRLGAMIASVLPDLDGLSILGGQEAFWDWHHKVGHCLLAGVVGCAILAWFAKPRFWSFALYLALFHLHMAMDMVGSGPGWGIYYWWPFSSEVIDNTPWSWEFYSWQNIATAFGLLALTIAIIFWKKRTPLEAIMPRLDAKMVRWCHRTKSGCR